MSARPSMMEFATQFRTHFPDLGSANHVLDPLLSVVQRAPVLDPLALEEIYERRHGAIPDGTSLADAVTARYGTAAAAWVVRML